MPKTEVITRLLVTPYLEAAMVAPVAGLGTVAASVTLDKIDTTGDVADRDENVWSGAVPTEVVCVGTVDVWDILAPGAAQFTPDGGWMRNGIMAGVNR